MDRLIAAALSFVARLFPNNRRHQPDQPGRHRTDSATRPIAVRTVRAAPVRAVAHVPGENVMQNSTNM
jgi:hypothetical protein